MINNLFQIKKNYGIIKYDGETIKILHNDILDHRFESLEYLMNESLKNINEDELNKIKPFQMIANIDFENDLIPKFQNYLILSNERTEETFPCWSFDHLNKAGIKDYDKTCEKIQKAGETPYIYDKTIWIGKLNSPTRKLFFLKFEKDSDFYLSFFKPDEFTEDKYQTKPLPFNYLPLEEHTKYKYLLDLEGNGGKSTRLKFLMFSNRPIFMQERAMKEYWMWDLVPFVHYIPIKKDLSDLKEKILWANSHDEECKRIADNALNFAKNNLKRKNAIDRISKILLNMRENKPTKKINILHPVHFPYGENEVKQMYLLKNNISFFNKKNLQITFLSCDQQPIGSFVSENQKWVRAIDARKLDLQNIYYIFENELDSEWIIMTNGKSKLSIDKIYNFLQEFNSSEDIIITSDSEINTKDDSLHIFRHLAIYDKTINIHKLNQKSQNTENLILSKGLIDKLKRYKFVNELIYKLNCFSPERPNEIIFLLSIFLGATQHKLTSLEETNELKSINQDIFKGLAIFYVNDWAAGIMLLNGKENFVNLYNHDNEFKFTRSNDQIAFFKTNGDNSSILKKIGKATYKGHPINYDGSINHGCSLTLKFLDQNEL